MKEDCMSNDTHNLSYQKFKALDYKLKKLSRVVDQLDILAFEARNAFDSLNKTYKDLSKKEKE
jgi:conjugal transfer/entry exclusion protein